MPFYEYECSACKSHIEVMQKISEPALTKCPECGKNALQRLISAPVFRLKGAGWYETDFKSDKEKKRNLVDGKEPAAKSDSDDKKSTVRSSKALKKAVAKKAPTKKAPAKKAPAKKVTKPAAKKAPAKKLAKKKLAQKAAKKAAKKRPSKPAVRKK